RQVQEAALTLAAIAQHHTGEPWKLGVEVAMYREMHDPVATEVLLERAPARVAAQEQIEAAGADLPTALILEIAQREKHLALVLTNQGLGDREHFLPCLLDARQPDRFVVAQGETGRGSFVVAEWIAEQTDVLGPVVMLSSMVGEPDEQRRRRRI